MPLVWDGNLTTLGDTSFLSSIFSGLESTDERFIVWKTKPQLDALAHLVEELRPSNIVELGIAEGGSTALLNEMIRPDKLVALDIREVPVPLIRYIRSHGYDEVVKPFGGVDQGDRATLEAIVGREFDGPLDLVLDDASHRLVETRASFDVLFPRLRPGGIYVIEDWTWGHKPVITPQNEREAALAAEFYWPTGAPLSIMLAELAMVMATDDLLLDEIVVVESAIQVRRGPASIPSSFELSSSFRPGGVSIDYRESVDASIDEARP